MHIHYLHHSAVSIALEQSLLIFDHYLIKPGKRMEDGYVGMEDISAAPRVFVFVSHNHHDHYNRSIFEWAGAGVPVTYILDDTVPASDAPEGAVFLSRGQEYDDGYIYVRAFGSTDIGGSFYVECEGMSFFHAGDFNNWHWKDEGDERYTRAMEKYFERELAFLRHATTHIDYAFFPVDKRLGSDYDKGADRFIDVMKPKVFIPIHFGGFSDTESYRAKKEGGGTQVLAIRRNGERLV